jgi:protein SEY1
MLILLASGAYVTYTLNLWGPMIRMSQAAADQALVIGKEKLREFLENTDTGRQAMAMSGREEVPLSRLDGRGKKVAEDDDEDNI